MAGKGEGVAPVVGGVMQNIGLGECRPEEKKRTQKNEHGDGKPPLHESTVGDGSLENAVVHGTPHGSKLAIETVGGWPPLAHPGQRRTMGSAPAPVNRRRGGDCRRVHGGASMAVPFPDGARAPPTARPG